MFGMIGLLGCIYGAVLAACAIVATIVDVAYSADAANDQKAMTIDQNKKNEERANQSSLVQQRQQQLSMLRAAQSAVDSVMFDTLQTEKDKISAQKIRKKLNRVGQTPMVRPERNYGTTLKS